MQNRLSEEVVKRRWTYAHNKSQSEEANVHSEGQNKEANFRNKGQSEETNAQKKRWRDTNDLARNKNEGQCPRIKARENEESRPYSYHPDYRRLHAVFRTIQRILFLYGLLLHEGLSQNRNLIRSCFSSVSHFAEEWKHLLCIPLAHFHRSSSNKNSQIEVWKFQYFVDNSGLSK